MQAIMKKLEEADTQINRGGEPSSNGRVILADLGHRTLNWTEPTLANAPPTLK